LMKHYATKVDDISASLFGPELIKNYVKRWWDFCKFVWFRIDEKLRKKSAKFTEVCLVLNWWKVMQKSWIYFGKSVWSRIDENLCKTLMRFLHICLIPN
jgi:hypothetical protein